MSLCKDFCREINNLKHFKVNIDVHLMVNKVDNIINNFKFFKLGSIIFHPECSKDISKTLKKINSFGFSSGLAINPKTPLYII